MTHHTIPDLAEWPAARVVALYKKYQVLREYKPDLLSTIGNRNPVLSEGELALWAGMDSDIDLSARHYSLTCLSQSICPHSSRIERDCTYGGNGYQFDLHALLLRGDASSLLQIEEAPVLADAPHYEEVILDRSWGNLRRPGRPTPSQPTLHPARPAA